MGNVVAHFARSQRSLIHNATQCKTTGAAWPRLDNDVNPVKDNLHSSLCAGFWIDTHATGAACSATGAIAATTADEPAILLAFRILENALWQWVCAAGIYIGGTFACSTTWRSADEG